MGVDRRHWLRHVKDVVRSRHYTWLPRGLGGEKVDSAMTYLLTDVMHVCKMAGASFDDLLAGARARFEVEESGEFLRDQPVASRTALNPSAVDAIVAAFETTDPFSAEIMRARLESEDIECRVDSRLRGGLKGQVDAKVMVNTKDAERATRIVQQVQETTADLEE